MTINKLLQRNIIDPIVGVNYACHTQVTASTQLHTHDFHEIFIINRGQVVHRINNRQQVLNCGTLVFIRPDDIHSYKKSGTQLELINLAFPISLLNDCVQFAKDAIDLNYYYDAPIAPTFALAELDTQQLVEELRLINDEGIRNQSLAKLRFKVVILNLFVHFFPKKIIVANNIHNNVPIWLLELREQLKARSNFVAGLAKMHQLAYCSKEHLCRSWKQYFNETPTEFINKLRVEHAARQLLNSDEKIYSIACDAGFENLSNFYHQFKKYYHLPPAAYRKLKQHSVIP